jgi:peptidoglycan-associated lipoprotein
VQANGEYLAAHKTAKARVEGNADERGSSEYNLALGQRRAENTKRGLVASGATAAQIETVSFGEEKPADAGHNEAAWAKNRRADIVAK